MRRLCAAAFRPENLLDEHRTDDTALVPDQARAPPTKAAPNGKLAPANTAGAPAASNGKRANATPLEYELQR